MIRRLRIVALAAATVAMVSAALAETDGERIAKILTPAIKSCWSIIAPPEGQKARPFSVSFKLNPDGSVSERPVSPKEPSSDYERLMIASGVRAILKCGPYNALAASGLPYEAWRDIDINFSPDL